MSLTSLPPSEVEKLRILRASGDLPRLKRHVAALRAQKWPLRAIGAPLGVSRSTVQYWERTANVEDDDEALMSPRAIETAGVRVAKWRTHIPSSRKAELRTLADQARRVRSQTPKESPLRQAADRLDELIEEYLDRMVPLIEIAEAMGVTHRAVSARIERRRDAA